MSQPKAKRSRDPLAVSAYEKRYVKISQTEKVYLEGTLAKTLPYSPEKRDTSKVSSKKAKIKRHGTFSTPSASFSSSKIVKISSLPKL